MRYFKQLRAKRIVERELAETMDWWAGGDPFDHFPWTFTPYAHQSRKDGIVIGGISTPNGRRPDESMHTYRHIAGEMWVVTAGIICDAVNLAAAARYGTPIPAPPVEGKQQ